MQNLDPKPSKMVSGAFKLSDRLLRSLKAPKIEKGPKRTVWSSLFLGAFFAFQPQGTSV